MEDLGDSAADPSKESKTNVAGSHVDPEKKVAKAKKSPVAKVVPSEPPAATNPKGS